MQLTLWVLGLVIFGWILFWNIKRKNPCFLKKHQVPENWLVEEMGAVFNGGICPRCGKSWLGEFVCNAWGEEKKITSNGLTYISLGGVNPILKDPNWVFKGRVETLQAVALAKGKAAS